MKKRNKALALLLAGAMVLGTTACGQQAADTKATSDDATATTETAEATAERSDTPLVIACEDLSEKFSPFFANSVPDQNAQQMTQINLLSTDREGAIVYKGIEGETRPYNGTDYTYYGPADLEVVENEDGTVDYNFTLRDDIVFSDGEKLTADDAIFSMYTLLDPSYDGAGSMNALPIVGYDEYRSGAESLFNLLCKAGAENTDFTYFTEDQQKKFFETDLPAAGEQFAQSIADYCTANGHVADDATVAGNPIANAMANWGYGTVGDDGSLTAPSGKTYTMQGDDVPTAADFWNEIVAAYDGDVVKASDTEKASDGVLDYLPEEYKNAIETGSSAENISGIVKTGDYSFTVKLATVDAPAIYQFTFSIAPLHYYGDVSKYDYDNNKFGFDKGDLSICRSKTTQPLGAGPFKFIKYENKTVYYEANDSYYKGAPKIASMQFKTSTKSDMEPGVVQGTIDIADPNGTKDNFEMIAGENSNGELSGDVLTTVRTDTRGYGYIGINSNNVKVGDDNGSEESKDLRKAIATVLSVYRDVVIDSYYGEAASVINYPISATSWAAPQASDPDYEVAFSTDVNGDPIYTDGMSDDEKYAAALQAALGFFEAAGYTVEDGKLTAAPAGAKLTYEVMIGGDGKGDHPSFGILTAASEALASIGFELKINDLADGTIMWNALEAETAELWCAAWQTTPDPDMYQIYHSKGGSAGHYGIRQPELDDMVMEARTVTDQSVRKALYKEALDYVIDFAVEVPIYQRQDCTIFSTQRVNVDTIAKDCTTYWSYLDEIETLAMN